MKTVISNILIIVGLMFFVQTTSAAPTVYDFVDEASGNEHGDNPISSEGDGNGPEILVEATGSNYAQDTDYFAYLDDLSAGLEGGLGVCQSLDNNAQCDPSSDDNLAFTEMLTLTWEDVQTIAEITFRDGDHRNDRFDDQDFEVRIDGGDWMKFSMAATFSTPLTGMVFDFITADTYDENAINPVDVNDDNCVLTGGLFYCRDDFGTDVATENQASVLYISTLTLAEVPEPGMIALFLLGMGLVGLSSRKRHQA